MTLQPEHVDAIRALRSLTPQERLQAMWELEQADLHEAERAKDIGEIRVPDEQFESLCQHILDGGGRSDADGLIRVVLGAVWDRDQAVFWPELIHFLKSAGKHLGCIVVQNGQVQTCGIGPSELRK